MTDYGNLFSLRERRALVTGAGGCMGQEICAAFASLGADVACLELTEELAERGAAAVRAAGRQAYPVVCDIRNPADIQTAVDRVMGEFGRVDILVNLAGKGTLKPVLQYTLEDWDDMINVFLRSTFLFCQKVGRHMLDAGRGSIVNISSISSVAALGRGTGAYAASKAGVNALTREFASDWAKKGIRVNAIAPCQIDTPPLRAMFCDPNLGGRDVLMKTWLGAIPMGRLGKPEEIAAACVFLASDASSLITGQVLMVDGGFTIK